MPSGPSRSPPLLDLPEGELNIELNELCAALEPVLARNPHLKVSAKVASNHSHILSKDFRAVAQAVREVEAAQDREAR